MPKIVRRIMGDLFNVFHSWQAQPDGRVTFGVVEIRLETDYVKLHIQKVAAFFAAMQGQKKDTLRDLPAGKTADRRARSKASVLSTCIFPDQPYQAACT